MKLNPLIASVALGLAALLPGSFPSTRLGSVHGQQTTQAPKRALISIYHVAPGKHLDFLKWQAQRDAIATAAGLSPTQWYRHTDGDSWDYLTIGPVTTDEQDQKVDALAKQRGLTSGFAASLEFRQFVSSHTDTFTEGPMAVADLVSMAGKR
jgi:hypothetical protein